MGPGLQRVNSGHPEVKCLFSLRLNIYLACYLLLLQAGVVMTLGGGRTVVVVTALITGCGAIPHVLQQSRA